MTHSQYPSTVMATHRRHPHFCRAPPDSSHVLPQYGSGGGGGGGGGGRGDVPLL